MNGFFVELADVDLFYPSSPLRTFSLKEYVFNLVKLRKSQPLIHDVHALRSVSLHISEGQRVGVIGPNGAGKTTLLRAIGGIYPIRSGTVRTNGRIRSLFELGLGFEMEATGRENIMYRGLLLGQQPAHIAAKRQEIIRFADIGEFIDYPVKTYSTGMYVRLAFAVSTSFGADILLLDEIMGAGDASFRHKARRRILELISSSRILVFVSHNTNWIRQICNRVIWLDRGHLVADGSPDEVIDAYVKEAT